LQSWIFGDVWNMLEKYELLEANMAGQMMSEKEKAAVMMKSIELRNAGKDAEAHALLATIPMPPYLAKVAKEKIGAGFLIAAGYNLSDAESAFGQDWLTR
jgi:hypothetical protein